MHQKAIEKEIVDGEELDFDSEAPVITPGTAQRAKRNVPTPATAQRSSRGRRSGGRGVTD
ncbi:MAG: hypothetical protein ACREBR_00330 [bacterium]